MHRSIKKHFLNYLFSKKKGWIVQTLLLGFAIFLIFLFLNFNSHGFFTKERFWDKWLEPGIGLFTAVVTIFIALQNIYRDWNDSIPKRLTVHFVSEGKYIMTCYEAFLSSEADIRMWGQQIGGQMAKDNLAFFPYIKSQKEIKKIDPNSQEVFIPYTVYFYLKTIPTIGNANLKKKYLVWWDNHGTDTENKHGNKEVYFENQPTEPKSISEAEIELEMQKNKI